MAAHPLIKARTRAGTPCKRWPVRRTGRCPNHGGMSTGPRTKTGRRVSHERSACAGNAGVPSKRRGGMKPETLARLLESAAHGPALRADDPRGPL